MAWLLSSVFWALLAFAQFIAYLVYHFLVYVLWLLWPVVMLLGLLVFSAQSAQAADAGWLSWLWGSNTRELERSLNVAQEAARVASEAAQAQAQQAVAHAQQNARLAETLGQLSSERSNLAEYLQALSELGLKDSQWAAALNAFGPVLVCVAVLLVAALALWLANKPGESQHNAALADSIDLLVDELSAQQGAVQPEGIHTARAGSGSLRLEERRRKLPAALVGYAGESPEEGPDSEPDYGPDHEPDHEPDSEPMPF